MKIKKNHLLKEAIFCIVFLIFSCVDDHSDSVKLVEAVDSQTVKPIKEIPEVIVTDSTGFNVFWKIFRDAIIKDDTATIISLTTFPFKTRGELDSDPIVKYGKKDFIRVIHVYLKQDGHIIENDKWISVSELEEIKRTINPDKKDVQESWARIGDFEFEKKYGGWKLVFAFLQEPTREELAK